VLDSVRTDLLAKCPNPAPHTRFYFTDVPSEAGFLVGDGPSLRIWYGNPTLEGRLLGAFQVRGANVPPGKDRFFRCDSVTGWVELAVGDEELTTARQHNPHWADDHRRVALALVRGGDWRATSVEYAKLSTAFPDSAAFPYMAGLAAMAYGDSARAKVWIGRAAASSTADEEMRATARTMGILTNTPRGLGPKKR
jgi:hypothetical protein